MGYPAQHGDRIDTGYDPDVERRKARDFKVQYISFSKVLFDEAVFRLDPPFFRFIKDSPCYTHPADQEETINVIIRLFWLIYMDRNNVYRDMIVKKPVAMLLP